MYRYVILLAAVGMQLCLGATYSWSVYVQPLKVATGLLQGPAQLPFSVFYFVFPATMLVSGRLLERWGPRACAVAGGLCFGGGWVLAGLGHHHFAFTVAGIGGLAGVGAGLAYIVPIATCIQWFPRHKGLVTGIAVTGFGGGAALVSQVAGALLDSGGATPFETFRLLGLAFGGLVCAAGALMRRPPNVSVAATVPLTVGVVLGQTRFWVLYLAMLAGLTAGFTVNANLKELYPGAALATGVRAVALFALANAGGRLLWGLLFDRICYITALRANLGAQAAVLAAGAWLLRSEAGLTLFALLTGFNYGGVLVLYASSTARLWGSERVGQVYGWLFSANIPAAAAPLLAGWWFDRSGAFTLPFICIAVALGATGAGVGWLRRPDRPTGPVPGPPTAHIRQEDPQ